VQQRVAVAMVAVAVAMVAGACGGDDVIGYLQCEPTQATVVRVIDGDTVELDSGQRFRYLLVDTPEIGSEAECMGEDARATNESLVRDQHVDLVYDAGQCSDLYGRLLGYAYLDGRMVNRVLVERGFAAVEVIRPDNHPQPYRYEEEFLALERDAKARAAGRWGACP
jgi:micrococcal nuclease